MHGLQEIISLNSRAAARVRGIVTASNHSANVRRLKDAKAERQRKAKK